MEKTTYKRQQIADTFQAIIDRRTEGTLTKVRLYQCIVFIKQLRLS